LISVKEAKHIVKTNSQALQPVVLPLDLAAGLISAADIHAITDIPAFDQSSMDGYAFRFEDYRSHEKLKIDGEIAAGSDSRLTIKPQQAARIFTGAAVPQGADTVVMQEKTQVENNELIIQDEEMQKGTNVRPKGYEIKAGALALKKESRLLPAAIGFLAGMGVATVKVYPKPAISILVTGKELQQPGNALQYGQVYESNSFMLKAALQQLGITGINTIWVDDDIDLLQQALGGALQNNDMVLLTGGVSVGDYDYTTQAAAACGVTRLFHKVKQKPGKPLYFGKKENRLIFGLPGNPSSVLTCFYEYVIPALEQLTMQKTIIKVEYLPLAASWQKKPGLTHFLKARCENGKAIPLAAQESYRLSSFTESNSLICLDEDGSEYAEGDIVEVHWLGV
jgi:molybdopterin molybdotransferase